MVVFTEVEQEEIINEFLTYIEQQETKIIDDFLSENDNKTEEEEEEEEDDSYGFVTEKRLEKEVTEHHKMINNIETKNYIPLKHAMIKYMEQTNNQRIIRNAGNYSYSQKTSNWWYLSFREFEWLIEIKKNGNKWICSKEKLDAVDFNILYKYKMFERRFE